VECVCAWRISPARVLACLLDHAGLVVDRADLVQLLWPEESHGDFDHRLNKAVNKLRFVLGDDSTDPCFIQTLSRRGYRFIAEFRIVEPVVTASQALENAVPDPRAPLAEFLPEVMSEDVSTSPASKGWRWTPFTSKTAALLAIAVCLLTIFGVEVWSASRAKARPSIAVLSFRNLSGASSDAWLSTALSDWLTTDLSAGDQLRTIPLENIARAGMDLGFSNDDLLTHDTLSAIRKNLGADLVVSGSYATVPGTPGAVCRLDVRLQDTRNGGVVQSFMVSGAESEVLQLASNAGLKLRSVLGLPALSGEALGLVRDALPGNPDAARLYAEGVAALRAFDAVEASALLMQASSIEPQHMPTHAALAAAWTALGYDARATAEANIAYQGSENLPQEQKLLMEGLLHEMTKKWEAAAAVYGTLFHLYPDNIEYGLRLANAQVRAGKGLLALSTVEAMRRLPDPMKEDPRIDLMESSAAASISDYGRELQSAMQAEDKARKLGAKLLVAYAELQIGSAQRSFGKLPEALELWRQARETFESAGDRRGIANAFNNEGALLWQKGDGPSAKAAFQESISTSSTTGDKASLAFALSRLGIVDMYSGDPATARLLFHQALEIYRQVEDVQEQGYITSLLGDELMQRDQMAEAKKVYEESLALSRAVNDRRRIAGRLMDVGIIDTVQGDLETATELLEESLSIYRELGEKNRVALVQNRLSMVMLWQGKTSQAASTMERSLTMAREVGEANVVAEMYETKRTFRWKKSQNRHFPRL
jgi:eukaryotic-like serine/threonine-protein kinase